MSVIQLDSGRVTDPGLYVNVILASGMSLTRSSRHVTLELPTQDS